MKPPWEWLEEDLQSLVRERTQESISLDYKESDSLQNTDSKKNEISKDVSAFANAAGGTIIYGIREDSEGHFPECLDAGSDPSKISKEWLEQVISSRIQRRIDNIRINEVWLQNSSPGKVAYVVWIPQSRRAPHQAHDKRFYKRFNFQSVPMEEYEIRDVARRLDSPDLRILFGLGYPLPTASDMSLQLRTDNIFHLHLGFSVINESLEPAYHCVINFSIDRNIVVPGSYKTMFEDCGSECCVINGTARSVNKYTLRWGVEKKGPLLCGVPMHESIVSTIKTQNDEYFLSWQVNAPRMNERKGTTILSVSNGRARLTPICV